MSFVVDPEGLRAHGRAVQGSATAVAGDLAGLCRGIEPGGAAPFGPDDAIAAVYRELTATTGEALDLIGRAVGRSGGGLRRMADAFAAVDAEAGSGFLRLEHGSAEPS